MKVSFIIPLFNRLDLTRPCLASLQATLPRRLDHEIILVDDGSTDGTRNWLRTLGPPFRVVLNARNLGYAGSNNRGALAATGDILALLNSDLVLTRGWLQPMLRLAGWPGVGVVGNVQLRAADRGLDHAGIVFTPKCKPAHDDRPRWLRWPWPSRRVPAVTAACLLIRRDLFLQLRGFDENFHNGCEDIDLCFRARARGYSCRVALRSRILHHVSASRGENPKNEYNSRRLAVRWRDELMEQAAHYFAALYLRSHPGQPRNYDPGTVWSCYLNLLGLRTRLGPLLHPWTEPPMQVEEHRWAGLLGPAEPDVFRSSIPGPTDRAPTRPA